MDNSSKKGLKEIKFEALKEHVLSSLQRRNLAQTSRKNWTFIFEKIILAPLIKVKLLGENLREGVKIIAFTQLKGSCNQD